MEGHQGLERQTWGCVGMLGAASQRRHWGSGVAGVGRCLHPLDPDMGGRVTRGQPSPTPGWVPRGTRAGQAGVWTGYGWPLLTPQTHGNPCPQSQGVLHEPFHPHGDWACSSEPVLLYQPCSPLNPALAKGPCFLRPKPGDISYPPPTHSPHQAASQGSATTRPAQHRLLKDVGLQAATPPETRGRLDGDWGPPAAFLSMRAEPCLATNKN